ncbi:uncharacterized protein UDID_17662 [Ustilago sp. UG-2017a]|nr:uncharacterized protein UDID_17662 [Ustilago sp. UG-2017a]
MCVVSLLFDATRRQYFTVVWILIDTEGSLILQSGSLDLILKAVIHCGPGITQLNQLSTLWTLVSRPTHSHHTSVLFKESIWTLIVPHYLWTECPQQLVEIHDNP